MSAAEAEKGSAAAQQESMAVAEAAREAEWKHPSFVAELFMGRFRPRLVFPYPEQPEEDRRIGDEFCARLDVFLREHLDPDEVDRTREIPAVVLKGLVEMGCYGMKISKDYGGLGLSQVNYNRAIMVIASWCGSTATWLSAHQSIGVPQPLKLFGTPEQKKKYLPRFVRGELSAFALTEPDAGSDPAKMETTATPSEDGSYYVLNGTKLWCTNGNVADVLIVMAQTPPIMVNGKERKQITAFIVEKTMPGFEVMHRCDFMGLKAIQNGVLRFTNMKVPKENILWATGRGLKLALITLNTGRMTVPAAVTGMAKRALTMIRTWSNERVQWGVPIGQHEFVAAKISWMAAQTFAMDAVTWFGSSLADKGGADIRLEAAMAKLFCSEAGWRIADDVVQIRGGRGYETALSLAGRGETPIPAERMMRDARINLIIEGTSDIMRLFIAREAVDRHMRLAIDVVRPEVPLGVRVKTALRAAAFYLVWYPQLWFHLAWPPRFAGLLPSPLAGHLRFGLRASHRLARSVFHSMVRFGPKLEKRQRTLGRLVDIGTDIFALTVTLARAKSILDKNPQDRTPVELADIFCREARSRINRHFAQLCCNDDVAEARLARHVLEGRMAWLEKGVIGNL